MYCCSLCHTVSKPHEAMRRHTVYRTVPSLRGTRQEIEREIPVCVDCFTMIANGVPADHLHGSPTRRETFTRIQSPLPKTNVPVLVGKQVKILGQGIHSKKG